MWHAGEEDPDSALNTAENADSCAEEYAHLNNAENAHIKTAEDVTESILEKTQREAECSASESNETKTAESPMKT